MDTFRFLRIASKLAALNSPVGWFEHEGYYFFVSNGHPYVVSVSEQNHNSYDISFGLVENEFYEDTDAYEEHVKGNDDGEIDYDRLSEDAYQYASRHVSRSEAQDTVREKWRERWEESELKKWERMSPEQQEQYENDVDIYLEREDENGVSAFELYLDENVSEFQQDVDIEYDDQRDNLVQSYEESADLSRYTLRRDYDYSRSYTVTENTGNPREVLSTVIEIIKENAVGWNILTFSGDGDHAPVYTSMVKSLAKNEAALAVAVNKPSYYSTKFTVVKDFDATPTGVKDSLLESYLDPDTTFVSLLKKPLPEMFRQAKDLVSFGYGWREVVSSLTRNQPLPNLEDPVEMAMGHPISPLKKSPKPANRSRCWRVV